MFSKLNGLLFGNLRKQLTVGIVLVVTTMIFLFVWEMTHRQKIVKINHHFEQVTVLANSTAASSSIWVISQDYSGLQEIIQSVARYPHLRHALVLDLKGLILAHNDPTKIGLHLTDLPQKTNALVLQRTASLIDVTSPIMLADSHIGWVRIGLDSAPINAEIAEMWQNGILYILIGTVLSVLLASLTARYLTRRLDAIQKVANSVQSGMSGLRVDLSGEDEAAQLARQFNGMMDSLVQRQETLKESEERFRSLTEMSSDFYWETDAEHRFTQFTESQLNTAGLASFLGKRRWEIPHQSPDESGWLAHQGILGLHLSFRDFEIARLNSDGSVRHISVSGDPVFNASGKFTGYRGVGLNITERMRIKAAEQSASIVLRTSPVAIVITRLEDGCYLEVNDAVVSLFRRKRDDILGKTSVKIGFWPSNDTRQSWAAALHREHGLIDYEIAFYDANGVRHNVLMSSSFIEFMDESCIVSFIHDTTERKKIEQELADQRTHLEELVETRTTELTQALEVAKIADQTKDAFLANMSHELRTPLSAVIGMANLARDMSADPKLRDYLEKIVRSGQHLNHIINELLDLSKIAAGHMELEVISFSLRTVVAHVESVMSHRAAEKGLTIVVLIDDAVPDVLLGDPTRVAQILLNLIGNAIKFTEVGRVAVRVGLCAEVENRVCLDIDVEDTGIGMGPEDMKQLFKPFSQADVSVSRKFGGTGLGLTISQRLAEMMDGNINVSSTQGNGTTFKLRIWLGLGNAADSQSAEPTAEEALPKHYQDARILVADDQPLNLEIVEELLAAVGITPRLAENGQQVLDILTESGPDAFDLVLMDIQMPVMDGLTATRVLRSRTSFEKLPIIAMTAHTMDHEKKINAAAGMSDHIGKPFDNESFFRTLAKWIPASKQGGGGAGGGGDKAESAAEVASPAAQACIARDHLRGIDWANGLARFNGKEDRYRHWLADFVENAGELPGQIRSDLAAGHTESATRGAHTFKGRVGTLGMDDLHGAVFALEQALRDGTPAEGLLGSLEQSISEVRDELTRFFAREGGAGTPKVLEKIAWDDAYSVGVAAMDDQHKKLLGMINRLVDCHATRNCGSSGVFHEVLFHMFDYTQVHFKAEEDYLRRIDYPLLAAHQSEHSTFVNEMATFCMTASEGVQGEVAIHGYLKSWLLSHILVSDMEYRERLTGDVK
jgi:hemerythrin-like metal-binding protein/PAS domain S-box-containing protein